MKKMMIGLLLGVFAASVCAAEPIRIGVSLGLSGKYAYMSEMQQRGFQLWEDAINKQGGILGREVKLIIYDDKSKPERAKQLYQNMIEEEKLDFLFPPYSSELTTAILPITENHGYPMLTSGASADSIWEQGYQNVFGVYTPASKYTLGFLELLLTKGLTKVAIISTDDTFSRAIAKGADKWAKQLGMEVVLNKEIELTTEQLAESAREAKALKADAILMCDHFDGAVNMRRALKAINWYPKAYYASVGPAMSAYHALLGKNADLTFFSTEWKFHETLLYPGAKEFNDAFIKSHKEEPAYQAATAYAAGVILANAIEQAGSLDKAKVRDKLASMNIETLIGRYGVNEKGLQLRQFALVVQWINGKQELVWPIELATTSPQFP